MFCKLLHKNIILHIYSCSTVTAGRLLEQVEESSTGTRERKEQTSPSDPLRLTHSPKRHVFPLDHNYR